MDISVGNSSGTPKILGCAEVPPVRGDRFPTMRSIRKEVREFMHAAETLLGPIIGCGDLNQDERDVIGLYIQQIREKFPDV